MSHFTVLFGVTPELSWAELVAVTSRLHQNPPRRLSTSLAEVTVTGDLKPSTLLDLLGGTVKIYETVTSVSDQSALPRSIANALSPSVTRLSLGTLTNNLNINSYIKPLKQAFASTFPDSKLHVRLLPDPHTSSGIIDPYVDFLIEPFPDGYRLYRTLAVQDIHAWSEVDYSRPAVNPKVGMLPPKIARIMVNLAFPDPYTSATVYDPFCGTGTILIEALRLGLKVIGTDIDQKAVAFTQKNLDWYSQSRPYVSSPVFKFDVLSNMPPFPELVDAIVFEGDLGPPNLPLQKVTAYHKGLGKLYIGALKRLAKVLKPGGRLVCALPLFITPKGVKSYQNLIDSCEKYGYDKASGPFIYGRRTAHVKRSIYVLVRKVS